MLVALPSAIAFGVAAYAPLGAAYVSAGAASGIVGAVAVGLIAPIVGGTPGLITVPGAPSAMLIAGLAASLSGAAALRPESVVALLGLAALLCGVLQTAYGMAGGGRFIKYIPYSVISGYTSAVGLVMVLGQLPNFFGLPRAGSLWSGLASPGLWKWQAVAVGAAAAAVMVAAPRLTRKVPPVVLALLAGLLAYFGLGLFYPDLLALERNALVLGPIGNAAGSAVSGISGRWTAVAGLAPADIRALWKPALMLSILLSIDTFKTCISVDSATETRHDSNRELLGQGLANIAAALAGGIPGSGGTGPTRVNLASGGASRLSGITEGVLVLAAALVLGRFIAWIPLSALAGILLVVGARMIDFGSIRLLRYKSTVLDFLVIAAVVGVVLVRGLIQATAVGLLLTIFLFLRDQIQARVLRRKYYGNRVSSKRRRLQDELEILERKGREALICELQGNLFFGTTDQFLLEIEPDLRDARYVVLDMRRVHSVDFTAAHLLERIRSRLSRRGGGLIFSNIGGILSAGQDLRSYFKQLGLAGLAGGAEVFDDLDDAVEWLEDRLLAEEGALRDVGQKPLALGEFELLKGFSKETLMDLEALMGEATFAPGQKIFEHGNPAAEIYLLRRGLVKTYLPGEGGRALHLASYGRGDFFGELTFLNPGVHMADAVAVAPTDIYYTPRDVFDVVVREHHRLGNNFFTSLSETLGRRLQRTIVELRAFREG